MPSPPTLQLARCLEALTEARDLSVDDHWGSVPSLQRIAKRVEHVARDARLLDLADVAARVQNTVRGPDGVDIDPLISELRHAVFLPIRRAPTLLVVASGGLERRVLREAAAPYVERIIEESSPRGAWDVFARNTIGGMLVEVTGQVEEYKALLMRLSGDPTLAGVPVVAVGEALARDERLELLALGVSEIFSVPASSEAIAHCLLTHMGSSDRIGLELVSDPRTGLPTLSHLEASYRRVARGADISREPWVLAVARMIDEESGEAVRAVSDLLREALVPAAEVFRDGDDWPILMPSTRKSSAGARFAAVAEQASAAGTKLAFGGVEIRRAPLEAALGAARRMAALAVATGGAEPVLTALSGAQPARHRVLVAGEDAGALRELQGQGWEVTLREDGEQALDLLLQSRFDVVVTDLAMPVLDGLGLVRQLREQPRYRRTPIIVTSRYSSARHVIEALDMGADAVLTKPVDPQILAARIRSLLRKEFG